MSADAGAVVTGIRQRRGLPDERRLRGGGGRRRLHADAEERGGRDGRDGDGLARRLRLDAAERPGPLPGTADPRRRDAPGEGHVRQRRRLRLLDRQRSRATRSSRRSCRCRSTSRPRRRSGPQGGSIRSSDGRLHAEGAGGSARARRRPISIAITTNDAPGALGSGYEVSPGGLEFTPPALLSLRYGAGGLAVDAIDRASLAVLTDAGWGGLTGGRVDTSSRALLIRLWNTSPSAGSAKTRTVQAGSVSRFGTLAAFEVRSQDPLLPFSQGSRFRGSRPTAPPSLQRSSGCPPRANSRRVPPCACSTCGTSP